MKNRFVKRSRISEEKTKKIIDFFVANINALITAAEVKVDNKTAKLHFLKMRKRITEYVSRQDSEFVKYLQIRPNLLLSNQLSVIFQKSLFDNFYVLLIHYIKNEKVHVYADMLTTNDRSELKHLSNRLKLLMKADQQIVDFCFTNRQFETDISIYEKSLNLGFRNSIFNFIYFAIDRNKQHFGLDKNTFIYHLKESQWRYNILSFDERTLLHLPVGERPTIKKSEVMNSLTQKEKKRYILTARRIYHRKVHKIMVENRDLTNVFQQMSDELCEIIMENPL